MKQNQNMDVAILTTYPNCQKTGWFKRIDQITYELNEVFDLDSDIDYNRIAEFDEVVFVVDNSIIDANTVIANMLSVLLYRKTDNILILDYIEKSNINFETIEPIIQRISNTSDVKCHIDREDQTSVFIYLKSISHIPYKFVGFYTDNLTWFRAMTSGSMKNVSTTYPEIWNSKIDKKERLPKLFHGIIKHSVVDVVGVRNLITPDMGAPENSTMFGPRYENQIGAFIKKKVDNMIVIYVWIIPNCTLKDDIDLLNQFDEVHVDLSVQRCIGWTEEERRRITSVTKFFTSRDFEGKNSDVILLNMLHLGLLNTEYNPKHPNLNKTFVVEYIGS